MGVQVSSRSSIPEYVPEQLEANLQVSLLALLGYSTKRGVEVAIQVPPDLYDQGAHKEIAKATIAYRLKYGKAPGPKQMPILVEKLPLAEEQIKVARLLASKFPQHLKGMNRDFVVEQAREFAIRQNYKRAALGAAIEANKSHGSNDSVRKLMYDAIMYSPENLDKGMSLADERSLAFLDEQEQVWPLGIKPLDDAGIGLARGTLMLYLAKKNSGKSWMCVHVGRQMLKRGLKVLHISLEMSETQVAKRYHQAFNAMSRNYNKYIRVKFDRDKAGNAQGWDIKHVKPKLSQLDPAARRKLLKRMKIWHKEFNNLRIKRFPSGKLTVSALVQYLDQLGSIDDFYPDVVLLDYPDLMEIKSDNHRLDTGRTYVDLRGLAVERNFALFTPSQINRQGYEVELVTSVNSAEDISKVNTADIVLTYSQTRLEKTVGLARLYANHVRDSEAGAEVAISQAYAVGQYVVSAHLMGDSYKDTIRDQKGKGKDDTPAEPEGDKEGSMI